MLAYSAVSDSSFAEQGQARELLADETFARTIWQASVAQPLALRTVGSLRKYRDKLIEESITAAETLREPHWYQEMVQRELTPEPVSTTAAHEYVEEESIDQHQDE
jgi:hypothetical protein